MHTDEIDMIRRILPAEMPFHYYRDRESPWLLGQLMDAPRVSVSTLRKGPAGKLLDRPLVQPYVARSGGVLEQRDLMMLGRADRPMPDMPLSSAAIVALNAAYQVDWQDYQISFAQWVGEQTSRSGGNLVLQLGFPTSHAALLARHFRQEPDIRRKFEYGGHPIRQTGRPTLAWVRLDIDLATSTCLIEEVQSDWFRFVVWRRQRLHYQAPQSHDLKATHAYEVELQARYARDWARVALLAALILLREELAIRDVWMHMPETGAQLKQIRRRQPPRSLYTQLPRAFCFTPTRDVPPFLRRGTDKTAHARPRLLRALERQPGPLFWHHRFG